MNPREVTMKYSPFAVLICHDSAGIWGFWYGLTLGFDTLKIMASTGVFVLVVFALKNSISEQGGQPTILLT
jgi:hypothetical protein